MDICESSIILSESMPVMAIRGLTVFPNMVINFEVDRPKSLAALDNAFHADRRIFLVGQKDVLVEDPREEDLYTIGTICTIRSFIRVPNGGMRVMVEGKHRAKMLKFSVEGDFPQAEVAILAIPTAAKTNRIEAQRRKAVSQYESLASFSGNGVPETVISLASNEDPGYVADYIAQNLPIRHTEKQKILELLDPAKRLAQVNSLLSREIEIAHIDRDISDKLHEQVVSMQREHILREQMRVIQSELGNDDADEFDDYRRKIAALKLDDPIKEKLFKEVDRLAKQPFGSAESSVIRSYLDVCLELPWNYKTHDRIDVSAARKVLDRDHFGLTRVKDRILEYLSVKQLSPNAQGTIICLVGPPGVGKTSIAFSIAKAMGRKMARLSLGGVHDEAEIRGHRKTYVGAMPGRIISAVNQAGSMNPLILLDEIDKLSSDFRGDPASALLEALDPEQNKTFRDNFLEIPFDLSDVMFITTANTTSTIPAPLLDRMEIIELSSYTDEEKLEIARRYLVPKQRKKNGLNGRQIQFSDTLLREIISCYTRESGVRQLEREIGAVCRKAASLIVEQNEKRVIPTPATIENYLGVRKFKADRLLPANSVGIVTGLAWTSVGGETLEVEAVRMDGTGKIELTGNLGDVMKESAMAAVTYLRSRAERFNIDPDFYKKYDIHIHFPEGAIPKDGPSAGITIAVAVISALTGAPVMRDVAMTGEITISGRILPIGGLKEKTMAALRRGIRLVIIPEDNVRDLEEIDQTVREKLEFVTTGHLDDILSIALDLSAVQSKNPSKEIAVEDAPVISVIPLDNASAGMSIRQ